MNLQRINNYQQIIDVDDEEIVVITEEEEKRMLTEEENKDVNKEIDEDRVREKRRIERGKGIGKNSHYKKA